MEDEENDVVYTPQSGMWILVPKDNGSKTKPSWTLLRSLYLFCTTLQKSSQVVNNLLANAGDPSLIPGLGESLKELATHSSIPAWKIPWTQEPGGLQSLGSQRVRHD